MKKGCNDNLSNNVFFLNKGDIYRQNEYKKYSRFLIISASNCMYYVIYTLNCVKLYMVQGSRLLNLHQKNVKSSDKNTGEFSGQI